MSLAREALAAASPASGAVVMGTGIVSVALDLDGLKTLSEILLVLGVVIWVLLGMLLVGRALLDSDRLRTDASSPTALNGTAGTAVLGTRLTLLGWTWAGATMLLLAAIFWLVLIGPVLRNWTTPTVGSTLVLTVSTESLAVLAAALADRDRTAWLLDAALGPFLLGLGLYMLVVARFDFRQLTAGRGDHWITGGALAISTLAAAQIAGSATTIHALGGISGALKDASVALWIATIAWLPPLVAAEIVRPRLDYDVRRWATVFPLGMYATCSFSVGATDGLPAITDFGRVWIWVAVAVWSVTFAGMLRLGGAVTYRGPERSWE